MRSCPRCFSPYAADLEFCGIDGTRLQVCDVDPLIGRDLDRFHIVALLGDGGMARVYRAKHGVLDREFAVKVLYGEIAADKKLAERFRREAQVISKLSHPNIVSVLDFGSTADGLTFLTMEMIPGRTLRSTIKKEAPLDIERAGRLARQMAAALAAAHSRGFVHRDLKPSNIMISEDCGEEVVKILDFGLVHASEGDGEEPAYLTRTGQFVGTPMYTAPEQIIGAEVTHHADLYALGVVLFEMIEGVPPFRAKTLAEIRRKHLHDAPPPLRPALGLENLVADLLKKDVESRPQTALEVMEKIDTCLGAAFCEDVTQKAPAPVPGASLDMQQPQLLSLASSSRAAAARESHDEAERALLSAAYAEAPSTARRGRNPEAFARRERTTQVMMNPDPEVQSNEAPLALASFLDDAESETHLPDGGLRAVERPRPQPRETSLASSIASDISIPPLSSSALEATRRTRARWVVGGLVCLSLGVAAALASSGRRTEEAAMVGPPPPDEVPATAVATSPPEGEPPRPLLPDPVPAEPSLPESIPTSAAVATPTPTSGAQTAPAAPETATAVAVTAAQVEGPLVEAAMGAPPNERRPDLRPDEAHPRTRARSTVSTRETPKRVAAAALAAAASSRDSEAALTKVLAGRGLYLEDLERDPANRMKIERWRANARAKNAGALRDQLPELERLVRAFPITTQLVRERLDRISDRLNAAGATLPIAELRPLEDRYLELARAVNGPPSELESTLQRASDLARQLNRAVGRR